MRIETVLAGRSLGLGITESAFPRAERIGADIEHRGRFGCLERAHGKAGEDQLGEVLSGHIDTLQRFLRQTRAIVSGRRYGSPRPILPHHPTEGSLTCTSPVASFRRLQGFCVHSR